MKRWIAFLLVIAVVAGGGYAAYALGYLPAELTQVLAAPAIQDTGTSAESVPAETLLPRVVADAKVVPIQHANLSMAAPGIVKLVTVKEGDRVEAGQLLVKLDDAQRRVAVAQAQANLARAEAALAKLKAGPRAETIAAAQAAVDAATANYEKLAAALVPGNIESARAALSKAQAEYSRVVQGPTQQMLIAAKADMEAAEAQLNQARSAYNKVKDLADVGMRPESLAMQQATIAYEAAVARYNDLLDGATSAEIASAGASVRQAQAQLETLTNSMPSDLAAAAAAVSQAEAQLEELLAGARPEDIAAAEAEVAAATAQLQQALVALGDLELRAPFAGVIATLNTAVGEQVTAFAPVIQLADSSAWEIQTSDLTELDVVGINGGRQVTLTFDAIPDLELQGTVNRIRPIGVDNRGDTVYTVIVTPDQQDGRLLWNMTAVVDFGVK